MHLTDDDRWLIYRRHDGTRLAAVIAEEHHDHYVVIEAGERRTVRKERGQQRAVPATSLDLLHVREPEALRKRFDEDEVETIVAVLADRARPMTKEGLVEQLASWGVDVDIARWKKLQPRLAKHANVEREGTPTQYRWREAVKAQEPVEKVITRALSPRTPPDALDEARRTLTALANEGLLSPTERALAHAAGASVPPPEWSEVSLLGLDERPAEALIEKAAERRGWEFVAAVALEPGQPARSARAAELLAQAAPDDRERPIRDELTRLASNMPLGTELGPYLDLLERRAPLVDRALGTSISSTTVAALVRLALAVPRETTAEAAPRLRLWALTTAAAKVPSRRALVAALDEVGPGRTQWLALRAALVDAPLELDGPRCRWIAAFAQWPPSAPTVHDQPEWWERATLADLAALDADFELGPLLRSPLASTQILGAAVRRTLEGDPASLPSVLSLPAAQLRVLDPATVAEGATRIDPSSPLGAMIEALREQARVSAEASGAALLRDVNERHEAELARIAAELEAARDDIRASEDRRQRLAEELDTIQSAQTSTFDGHRAQAQLEALRALAELLHEIEVALPAVIAGELSVGEATDRLRRLASEADVEVDAEVDTVVTMDRSIYRAMDGDHPNGAPVRVVVPAYVRRAGTTVTPLRYGYVVAVDR